MRTLTSRDLLRQSLQKVFARTLGSRDYPIFEAVHLGLGLPQVFELLPTVTLNTYGTRALKPKHVIDEQDQDQPISYDSKVDKFDRRLETLRKQNRGLRDPAITEAEIRDVSLYEFYWKFMHARGQLAKAPGTAVLMVTPAFSADSACVLSDKHADYARSAVIAYWRNMPTERRHRQLRELTLAQGEATEEELLTDALKTIKWARAPSWSRRIASLACRTWS